MARWIATGLALPAFAFLHFAFTAFETTVDLFVRTAQDDQEQRGVEADPRR